MGYKVLYNSLNTKNLHTGLLEDNKRKGKRMRIVQDWKKTEKICFNIVADLFHFFRHHLTTFTHLQDSYYDISRDCVVNGMALQRLKKLAFGLLRQTDEKGPSQYTIEFDGTHNML